MFYSGFQQNNYKFKESVFATPVFFSLKRKAATPKYVQENVRYNFGSWLIVPCKKSGFLAAYSVEAHKMH
jgi:hypothetical protein